MKKSITILAFMFLLQAFVVNAAFAENLVKPGATTELDDASQALKDYLESRAKDEIELYMAEKLADWFTSIPADKITKLESDIEGLKREKTRLGSSSFSLSLVKEIDQRLALKKEKRKELEDKNKEKRKRQLAFPNVYALTQKLKSGRYQLHLQTWKEAFRKDMVGMVYQLAKQSDSGLKTNKQTFESLISLFDTVRYQLSNNEKPIDVFIHLVDTQEMRQLLGFRGHTCLDEIANVYKSDKETMHATMQKTVLTYCTSDERQKNDLLYLIDKLKTLGYELGKKEAEKINAVTVLLTITDLMRLMRNANLVSDSFEVTYPDFETLKQKPAFVDKVSVPVFQDLCGDSWTQANSRAVRDVNPEQLKVYLENNCQSLKNLEITDRTISRTMQKLTNKSGFLAIKETAEKQSGVQFRALIAIINDYLANSSLKADSFQEIFKKEIEEKSRYHINYLLKKIELETEPEKRNEAIQRLIAEIVVNRVKPKNVKAARIKIAAKLFSLASDLDGVKNWSTLKNKVLPLLQELKRLEQINVESYNLLLRLLEAEDSIGFVDIFLDHSDFRVSDTDKEEIKKAVETVRKNIGKDKRSKAEMNRIILSLIRIVHIITDSQIPGVEDDVLPPTQILTKVFHVYQLLEAEEYTKAAIELPTLHLALTGEALSEDLFNLVSLGAAVAQAESSAEVTKALEQTLVPAGSYRSKRLENYKGFTINAYFGYGYGSQRYKAAETEVEKRIAFEGVETYSNIWVPIGLEYTWGIDGKQSFSVFASILDMGNAFYGPYQHVKFKRNGKEEKGIITKKKSYKIEDFIAPGFFVVWGFPQLFSDKWSPGALAFGVQQTANIYQLNYGNNYEEQADIKADLRIMLSISIDMPLMIFMK